MEISDLTAAPLPYREATAVAGVRFSGEDDFRKILTLERKRSERSHKPLLLLLVDIAALADGPAAGREQEPLLRKLAQLIRETDYCGWYRQGDLVGLLFAEIPPAEIAAARTVIGKKVWDGLGELLAPELCRKISISFHLFPQQYSDDEAKDPFSLPFYPELLTDGKPGVWAAWAKRGVDICGSLAALVLFSPLFLLLPLLVKITSPGPVFFRQKRLGQFGKPFTFLKFRSMKVDNDDAIHRQFIRDFIADRTAGAENKGEAVVYKIRQDPRLTPIGNFLRKSSLDELPQLINVLKGEMSLVGPRPPIPYEVADYALWHRRRILAQKPGITGLWQVTGRSRTTFDAMVRLDLQYARKRSLWLDIKLLLATPKAVIRGKGAF